MRRARPPCPPPSPVPVALLLAAAAALSCRAAAELAVTDLDLRIDAADIAPAVVVKQYDNRTVEEYSVNNNTYMLKVTPSAGAPYYLVDQDGSGDLEGRRNAPDLQVPQWTLMSW